MMINTTSTLLLVAVAIAACSQCSHAFSVAPAGLGGIEGRKAKLTAKHSATEGAGPQEAVPASAAAASAPQPQTRRQLLSQSASGVGLAGLLGLSVGMGGATPTLALMSADKPKKARGTKEKVQTPEECIKECEKECNAAAPGNAEYCSEQCIDFCNSKPKEGAKEDLTGMGAYDDDQPAANK